jgi:VanZ family protein
MLKRIKILLRNSSLIIALTVSIGILCLSLIKITSVPTVKVENIDKLFHSLAYFVLASCWLFTYYKKPAKKYTIVISCIVFGIIIEVLQMNLTSYRTGDLWDVLANTFGVLLALLVFNLVFKRKQSN